MSLNFSLKKLTRGKTILLFLDIINNTIDNIKTGRYIISTRHLSMFHDYTIHTHMHI